MKTVWRVGVPMVLFFSIAITKQSREESNHDFGSYDEILDFDLTVSPGTTELRLTDCKEKLHAAERRSLKLQVDKSRLMKTIRDLKTDRKSLRGYKKILQGNVTHLQEEIKTCKNDVQSLNDFIEGLQSDVKALNSQLAKTKNLKKSEKNNLEEELSICQTERVALEKELRSISKEKTTLKSQVSAQQSTMNSLKSDLNSCTEKMEKWPSKIAYLNDKISSLSKLNEMMQRNITMLMNKPIVDTDKDPLEGKIHQLNGNIEKLTTLLKNSSEYGKGDMDIYLNNSTKSEENEKHWNSMSLSSTSSVSSENIADSFLREMLDKIRNESSNLQSQIQILNEDNALIESEAESYRAMNEVLEIEKMELLQQISTKDFEITALNTRVTEIEKSKSELEIQNYGLKEANKNLMSEIELLKTKIESLRLHIETMQLTETKKQTTVEISTSTTQKSTTEMSVTHEVTSTTPVMVIETSTVAPVHEVQSLNSTNATLVNFEHHAEDSSSSWVTTSLLPAVAGVSSILLLMTACAAFFCCWCRRTAQTTTFVQGFQLDDPVPCTEPGHKNCTSHQLQTAWAAPTRKAPASLSQLSTEENQIRHTVLR